MTDTKDERFKEFTEKRHSGATGPMPDDKPGEPLDAAKERDRARAKEIDFAATAPAPDPAWLAKRPADYPAGLPWPPTLSPLGQAALNYAVVHRWRVHPLCTAIPGTETCDAPAHQRDKLGNPDICGKNRGKRPRLGGWEGKATTDPATVIEWWTKWPDANVGIVPGSLSAGLAVVDIDPRTEGWAETFERLVARLPADEEGKPALWRTTLVATGGGGWHLYYDATGLLDLPHDLGPGVEVKADDVHNIVAPPSVHQSGETYAVVAGVLPLAPYPREWLRALERTLEERTDAVARATAEGGEAADKALWALAALDVRRADDYGSGTGGWLDVGMALKAVDEGLLTEWDAWSRASPKWREGACAAKWAGFRAKEHGLGLGSLVKWAQDDEERAQLVFGDEATVERIDWLWYPRLAFGKLNGLVGLPDVGKDVITCDVAARLSRGAPMPDGRPSTGGDPRPTLYLSSEDAFSDTLLPRFLAAGGDRRYVTHFPVVFRRGGKWATLSLDEHHEKIERLLRTIQRERACGPGLVVLSPFDAFLSGKVDAWKSADIRRTLAPLTPMLDKTGWALEAIAHLNKDAGGKSPVHRIANSQAFGAALRVVWLAGRDPDDDARRALVPIKRNLFPDMRGLAYRFLSAPTPDVPNPGPQDTVPVVEWLGETALTDADVLAGAREMGKGDKARAWLLGRLGEGRANAVPAATLQEEAAAAGHGWPTVRAEKAALGVKDNAKERDARGQAVPVAWWLDDAF